MNNLCACGQRFEFTGQDLNQVEQWDYTVPEGRRLIYAVCGHGKVIVDRRPAAVPSEEKPHGIQ